MKNIYKGAIILLVLMFLGWLYYLNELYRTLIENASPMITTTSQQIYISQKAQNIAQSIGAFAALFASIIALSSADPRKLSIKMEIKSSTDNNPIRTLDQLVAGAETRFENIPLPLKIHRINFKMKNISGFTLRKPKILIKLPDNKRPPYTGFQSNIFVAYAGFNDVASLFFDGMPIWSDQYSLAFWIDMAIDDGRLEPFDTEISIDCENTDGITIIEEIDPQSLLQLSS